MSPNWPLAFVVALAPSCAAALPVVHMLTVAPTMADVPALTVPLNEGVPPPPLDEDELPPDDEPLEDEEPPDDELLDEEPPDDEPPDDEPPDDEPPLLDEEPLLEDDDPPEDELPLLEDDPPEEELPPLEDDELPEDGGAPPPPPPPQATNATVVRTASDLNNSLMFRGTIVVSLKYVAGDFRIVCTLRIDVLLLRSRKGLLLQPKLQVGACGHNRPAFKLNSGHCSNRDQSIECRSSEFGVRSPESGVRSPQSGVRSPESLVHRSTRLRVFAPGQAHRRGDI